MSEAPLHRAKSIAICEWLEEQGHKPWRKNERTATFFSPLHSETNASFHVNRITNRFVDYSQDDVYGDIIDLVCTMENLSTKEAIKFLLDDKTPHFHRPAPEIEIKRKNIEVVNVLDKVESEALIEYMVGVRKIPEEVFQEWCKEVHFKFASKPYATHYGVGMPTDKGGWSIRSVWFKGATRDTSVSTVFRSDTLTVCLYEGFIDYLSWVTLHGEPKHTSVILNSLVNVPMIVDALLGYDSVECYLDNDLPADDKMEYLYSKGVSVKDMRGEYSDYNDINDMLVSGFDM